MGGGVLTTWVHGSIIVTVKHARTVTQKQDEINGVAVKRFTKTTATLSNELLARAKAVGTLTGKSVQQLIVEGLTARLAELEPTTHA